MVILRKSDSATSLLLFVYNNFLTEYKKDTLKLSSLLEIMRVFGKRESATRMSLSRIVKAGILINENVENEVYYSLSQSGRDAIKIWNQEIKQFWRRYALRNNLWDKKWHLLNLEFGEEHKEGRNVVSERLKQMSFGLLTANTWISPYYQPDEVRNVLTEFDIDGNAVEMNGEITVNHGMESFVENTYHLKDLEAPYKRFVKIFGEKYEETKKIYQEEMFVKEGKALPLLQELGWEFFFIAAEDAALPRTLLPSWVGDEAAQLMGEYRSILLDAAIKYLGKYE